MRRVPGHGERRAFSGGDLRYLANLCHACGACHVDCQFTPPHEFSINVPKTMAELRADSYAAYAWPAPLAGLFQRNALVVVLALVLGVAAFLAAFNQLVAPDLLFGVHTGPGAFSKLVPHTLLAGLFGAAFLYVVLALFMGLRAFWRDLGGPVPMRRRVWAQALKDAATLRHLDGGGAGCFNVDDRAPDHRRFYHHLTMYGFLLCFAATAVGTLYHYLLGWEAPYAWYQLPVLLGLSGGIGLIIGPLGLIHAKWTRNRDLVDVPRLGMDMAFPALLALTSASGLLLLLLRSTSAMGLLLALHLGVVFALFVTMPYGKFVHGFYRLAALLRHAQERAAESETD